MHNSIEETLVSLDGAYTGAAISRCSEYRDDEAYMRDRLDEALGREHWEGMGKAALP